MRGDARALVQDLHRGCRRTDLHHFVHQIVGHAVQVQSEDDVIIDVHAGAIPLTQVEWFGGQRLQCRLVHGLEYAGAAALPFTERTMAHPRTLRQTARSAGQHASAQHSRRDPRLPAAGTVVRREYAGTAVEVLILEDGFEYDGIRYDSLSAIATKVTGTRWNGFLFFGLSRRTGRKGARR